MSLARNIGGEELGRETSMTKVGIAAFIGALVEWYDYFLYGLAASVVFTQLFFPLENRHFGTLAPFIATALLAWAGSYWPVALYVMAAGLISFGSVYLATESFREDLTEELSRDPTAQTSGASQTT